MDKLCLDLDISDADIAGELHKCADNHTVVIDLGSAVVKAGYAGHTQPTSVFPTMSSSSTPQSSILPLVDEVIAESFPMELDCTNYSDLVRYNDCGMERILQHTFFKELSVNPCDHIALVCQSFLNHNKNKERLPQLLFEKFGCPGIFLAMSNVLSLFSSGRITGVDMEIGASDSHCVPVIDGFSVQGHATYTDITGNFMTQHLENLLARKGYPVLDTCVVEDIKSKMCNVAPDLFSSLKESPEKNYCLPNGDIIQIGKEAFQCPEVMFNPNLASSITNSVPQTICECVEKVRVTQKQEKANLLYKNIILSGGSANFSNLKDRMKKELDKITPGDVKTNVTSVASPGTAAWIGGSILSSLSQFQPLCITKDEYNEHGINVIYRKCF